MPWRASQATPVVRSQPPMVSRSSGAACAQASHNTSSPRFHIHPTYATTPVRRGAVVPGTSIGTGSRTIGVPPATGAAACAAASPHGSSRSAAANTCRSRVRCHSPLAPVRLSTVGESNRTAHGTRGRESNSAVVALETITARASSVPRCARRAASPSTRSITVIWRRSLPVAPKRTRTIRQLAPAFSISSASASSARRRPSVVPSERRATSVI